MVVRCSSNLVLDNSAIGLLAFRYGKTELRLALLFLLVRHIVYATACVYVARRQPVLMSSPRMLANNFRVT